MAFDRIGQALVACLRMRDDDRVGAPQVLRRLAKMPRREQPLVEGAARCIDKDEIQIAGKPAVLEAIVQDKRIGV